MYTPKLLCIASGRRVSLMESLQRYFELVCVDSSRVPVPTYDIAGSYYTVPPWDKEVEFVDALNKIVEAEMLGDGAVISLMDPATDILIDYDLPKRWGMRLFGTSRRLNFYARDKRRTKEFFDHCGVCSPALLSSVWDRERVVARRLDGYGSRGMYLLNNDLEKAAFLAECKGDTSPYALTEFVDGPEYTVDCFKDDKGNIHAIVPRKRLAVRGGEVQRAVIEFHPELIRLLETSILPNADFVGCMCIQAIRANDAFYFIEINDRFGGGVPLSIAAGANFPGWMRQIMGGATQLTRNIIKPLYMTRADREFYYGSEYL